MGPWKKIKASQPIWKLIKYYKIEKFWLLWVHQDLSKTIHKGLEKLISKKDAKNVHSTSYELIIAQGIHTH